MDIFASKSLGHETKFTHSQMRKTKLERKAERTRWYFWVSFIRLRLFEGGADPTQVGYEIGVFFSSVANENQEQHG